MAMRAAQFEKSEVMARIKRRGAAIALLFSLTACGAAVRRPDGGEGLLPAGAPAPDVVGEDGSGHPVTLGAVRGHPAVVYFYPRDGTPGCTAEACAFRDAWDRYAKAGITIFGVSSDSAESHRAFRDEHHLPFPLVADEAGSLAAAYGVPKKLWGYARVTFLIDSRGVVARVWPSVDPAVNATEVLDAAASLR